MTPLYVAAQNGHRAMVEILVKAGADVNFKVSDVGCGEVLTSRRRIDPITLYSLSCNQCKINVS